jgi:hypothetical protein
MIRVDRNFVRRHLYISVDEGFGGGGVEGTNFRIFCTFMALLQPGRTEESHEDVRSEGGRFIWWPLGL